MPAIAPRKIEHTWTSPVSANRGERASRHGHAVQISGLERRVRHKQAMVGWLGYVMWLSNIGAAIGSIGFAAALALVITSFRAQEPILTGMVVVIFTMSVALFSVMTRFLAGNARRSFYQEISDAVSERNRLQYLR